MGVGIPAFLSAASDTPAMLEPGDIVRIQDTAQDRCTEQLDRSIGRDRLP